MVEHLDDDDDDNYDVDDDHDNHDDHDDHDDDDEHLGDVVLAQPGDGSVLLGVLGDLGHVGGAAEAGDLVVDILKMCKLLVFYRILYQSIYVLGCCFFKRNSFQPSNSRP